MKKRIYLLSGVPGSGKSTWVKNRIAESGGVWCSRDVVRFSLLQEGEAYFSRETEVFEYWIKQINEAICNPIIQDIYIDATHINNKSRNKTLSRLPKDRIDEIINVVFAVPLEICLDRNSRRTGLELVPESAVRQMHKNFEMPNKHQTILIEE